MAGLQARRPDTNTGVSVELVPPDAEPVSGERDVPHVPSDAVVGVWCVPVEVDGSAAAWQWSVPDLPEPGLAEV